LICVLDVFINTLIFILGDRNMKYFECYRSERKTTAHKSTSDAADYKAHDLLQADLAFIKRLKEKDPNALQNLSLKLAQ